MPAIFNFTELVAAKKAAPLLRDVWMEGNQVMAARSQSGSKKGLYVAAKGGHNDESHNHNDVGNFIVYVNGLPMIIDVGVETHTRKTFSAQRYNITVQIFVFLAKNFNSQKTIWTQRTQSNTEITEIFFFSVNSVILRALRVHF